MQTLEDIVRLIGAYPALTDTLDAVAALQLPDCWVVAGFVRNPVWDRLHGYPEPTPLADVDVVYFDAAQPDEAIEKHLEAALHARRPGVPWSVKNQARMAERNGDPPYRSTSDALTYWCETATAIGVRRAAGGEIEVVAPFGVGDLLGLAVRPTPYAARHKLAAYRQRMVEKNWPRLWPRLTVHHA